MEYIPTKIDYIVNKYEYIPILVICYNNYEYVDNTLKQIKKINENYYKNIIIINNDSTCEDTINYLKNVKVKIINNSNNGPWVDINHNKHIYDTLPNKYVLTDPDLEYNQNIPRDFIEQLSKLSDTYNTKKAGLALDISDFNKMYKDIYECGRNIYNWEIQFWNNKIDNEKYDIYNSTIDTTFALYNKKFIKSEKQIRVAGNFTTKHLPWYIHEDIINLKEKYLICKKQTNISTISRLVNKHIKHKYIIINKNKNLFLINKDINKHNLHFWQHIYIDWESDAFNLLNKFLDKNKIMIELGSWIGTSTMFCSNNSKHIYAFEADKQSFDILNYNLLVNCEKNYTTINKAVYNKDDLKIKFGKNKFLKNSNMNDSTSQIYNDIDINEEYKIDTITLKTIIDMYKINPNEISIIKIDIEGGEEYILNDLNDIRIKYNIPLFIRFHYEWWNDKNLDRFDLLTETHKNDIINNPLIAILFD